MVRHIMEINTVQVHGYWLYFSDAKFFLLFLFLIVDSLDRSTFTPTSPSITCKCDGFHP